MKLVRMADKLCPESPEVRDFYLKQSMDYSITGKHIVRVDPGLFYSHEEY
jgi:hypothetical protein